ncbi:MAG: phage major capsid protein [Proteobacteria bacterium]|nr:phage major capsid protein [Pseudomonadota bacterium]
MSIETVLKSLEKIGENQDALKASHAEFADRLLSLEQRGGLAFTPMEFDKASPLAKVSEDAGVIAVRNRTSKSATVAIDTDLRALFKSVTGDTGAEQWDVNPQRYTGQIGADPRRVLSLFDVLPRLKVNSNAFEFHRLDSYTNAAAYQATEGSAKAAGAMPTSLLTAPITTIAHYFKASEQVLSDVPALQMQMDNLLRYGVLAKAESELVAGNTAGKIQGLLTQATAFTATAGAKRADDIGEAMTSLRISGWNPGLVILHPTDWHIIRSERSATEKLYVAGGWDNPASPSIWNSPVLTTPSLGAGTALILDPSQCAILDRQQVVVEVGRDGDDFTKNLVTIRGEARLGFAVFSPSAVLKLALSDS